MRDIINCHFPGCVSIFTRTYPRILFPVPVSVSVFLQQIQLWQYFTRHFTWTCFLLCLLFLLILLVLYLFLFRVSDIVFRQFLCSDTFYFLVAIYYSLTFFLLFPSMTFCSPIQYLLQFTPFLLFLFFVALYYSGLQVGCRNVLALCSRLFVGVGHFMSVFQPFILVLFVTVSVSFTCGFCYCRVLCNFFMSYLHMQLQFSWVLKFDPSTTFFQGFNQLQVHFFNIYEQR